MASTDKSTAYIPLAGLARDGWSTETEATATCFCGAVQLSFVSSASLALSKVSFCMITRSTDMQIVAY